MDKLQELNSVLTSIELRLANRQLDRIEEAKAGIIEKKIVDGVTWYTTTYRGVEYSLKRDNYGRGWELWSKRKSLGPMNVGNIRYFSTLDSLKKSTKAFSGLELAKIAKVEA